MSAPKENTPFAPEEIAQRILVVRGQRVILDVDLARIYGVTTGRLNEQVKRNSNRFPEDFVFQLTAEEAVTSFRLRSQIAILKRGQNNKQSPYAFTEHGAIQAGAFNSEMRTDRSCRTEPIPACKYGKNALKSGVSNIPVNIYSDPKHLDKSLHQHSRRQTYCIWSGSMGAPINRSLRHFKNIIA